MRTVLLGVLSTAVMAGAPAPALALSSPSRQPCTMNLGTSSISQPIATGSTADTWVVIDMVGSVSCNAQPQQPATLTLYVTVSGCTSATGWGTFDFVVDGEHYETSMLEFRWAAGAASFDVRFPTSPGAAQAVAESNPLAGQCFLGLRLNGGFLFHLYAGTPFDDG